MPPLIESAAQLEEALSNIVQLTADLREVEGQMNKSMDDIRKAHEPRITTAKQRIEAESAAVKAYAEAHPELFGKRKSAEFTHGTIGYRTGTPKLKTLKGWTWDRVKEKLQQIGRSYLRVTEEVNKEALLVDREVIGTDKMKEFGISVVQDETFYVEPKMEEVAR